MEAPATALREAAPQGGLPLIPIIETGPDFPLATLRAAPERTHALLDIATRRYPRRLLAGLDGVSRAWLKRWDNAHLGEIDAIARALGRPGAYFFSINYEWGCTCRAVASPDGGSARLIRVLDWKTPGLGSNITCAKVDGAPAGPFAVMTWPGYSGVLQVMAPGRFSASLNQAPMRNPTGLYYLDWAANRRRVWQMPHPTPAHLLRRVTEEARDFSEARRMLCDEAISTPAIFTLAGISPDETAVIERTEVSARVREERAVAANHWDGGGWPGQSRGEASLERAEMMHRTEAHLDPEFPWLTPPVLNENTRLVMVADAKAGRLVARGYEAAGPATETLELIWGVGR